MVKTYKNASTIAYVSAVGLLFLNTVIPSFAQEGFTDGNFNGEMPNQTNISDKVNTTEQPEISDKVETIEPLEDFKKLSDEINNMFQKYKDNLLEIGGEKAYKKTINGKECYFVEGFDYAFLKIKLGDNISHSLIASINYAIAQGFKEVVSILHYTEEEINLLKNAIKKEGEATYAIVKISVMDTRSSAQDKGE